MKNKIVMLTVGIICLSIIFTTLFLTSNQNNVFNEKNFPLQTDLSKNVFNVGEKISFTATITNKCGKIVTISSNGAMPCAFFHNINDATPHAEITVRVDQILVANGKMSQPFEWELPEAGTYVLNVHYSMDVNGIGIRDKLEDIIIEVK